MKTIVLLLASLVLVESYDRRYEIEVLKAHMDCYLHEGPCDEVSLSNLQFIQHAVETSCSDCTEENKHAGWTLFQATQQYLPEEYEKFIQKYDPERRHWDKLMEVITPKQ